MHTYICLTSDQVLLSRSSYIQINVPSFMGNCGWCSRSFKTYMHFLNLTCTNRKRKNTGKPGLELLTFRVSKEWLKNLYFDQKIKKIKRTCIKKYNLSNLWELRLCLGKEKLILKVFLRAACCMTLGKQLTDWSLERPDEWSPW